MFKAHLKFAFKSVRKHKIPSFINFFGFTLGLTGAILLMSILWHDLNYDGYHSQGDRIYRLTTKIDLPNGARHFASSSAMTGNNLAASLPEVEATIRTRFLQANMEIGDKTFSNEAMLFADAAYYRAFEVKLMEGQLPDGPNDLLISERTRERFFGNENAIGEIIEAAGPFGNRSFRVAGVYESYPTNVSVRPPMLGDFSLIEPLHNTNYASIMPGLETYLLTHSVVDQSVLQDKLNQHFQEVLPENIREVIVHEAQAFQDIHLIRGLEFDAGQKHDRQTLWVLGVLAAFIIGSTFINFFNMQTALVAQRMKELSIKRALGQTAFSNVLQTSFEALVVLLPAVVLCGLLVHLTLTELEAYTSMTLKTAWLAEDKFIWILTGILLSFWALASVTSIGLMKVSSRQVKGQKGEFSTIFKKGLIGLQFALAGFFILNAMVISNQLNYISQLDLGYENDDLIAVNLNGIQGYEQALTIKNVFESISGVKNTSVSQSTIFGNQGKANFAVQMDTGSVNHMLNINFIDPDFIETNQMTLLAGENIREGNRAIILNEQAVESLGFKDFQDALGRQMTYTFRDTSLTYQIAGVVSDYHYTTMHQSIEPIVLFQNEMGGYNNMSIRVEGNSLESILSEMESTWTEFFPGSQLSYRVMEDVLDRAYEDDFQKGKFYQWATLLLVSIAALGIFGLTYYYADQKRKEIGVRKAIGARLSHIIGQIARPIAVVCFLAALVAIPLGIYFSQQWLNGYQYGIEIGVGQVALTIIIMFSLSTIALLYPGIKASRINPVEALREE